MKSLVRALRRGRTQTQVPALRARRERSRGQALVELVVILPVLLLIVLVALDLGRVFLGWVVLNNAARVGANYAALHPDAWGMPGNAAEQTAYEDLVRDARADAGISLRDCETQPVPAPVFPGGVELGDFAQLDLACQFSPITPLIGNIFASTGNELTVSARSVFPIRSGVLTTSVGTPAPVCPLADFTWDPLSPLIGESVAFSDTSAGNATSWVWDFGDGAVAGNANPDPSHIYDSAGVYTVTLTVNLCSSLSRDLTVSEPPPSPDPDASPEPTVEPTLPPSPEPCQVPGFAGTRKNNAQSGWADAGFTTQVTFLPGNGNYTIEYQSVVGFQPAPCNIDITVGPDPAPAP